ncbi:4-hydroxythreonine-4-phosphate dehydrogenase PdxA [Kangiella sp. TOML190]|uniref:4-hydroxythreonine-4-phosphate dehydrogenase PdxA n=1 Tax=Kangiella sp. TOML190 TaxID=2931351 RepID=UPI002040DFAE|nr:4-hydroxythreonine-4-phosphate dehydrogenase PdxA [Kangiella sp. TOML190]
MKVPRILLTAGEPAGIGPEILVKIAQEPFDAELIACADAELLTQTAKELGLPLQLIPFEANTPPRTQQPSQIKIIEVPLSQQSIAGQLNRANADYVLNTLRIAAQMALDSQVNAIVTGPVHKGIINDAGIAFSGHTEFFADKAGVEKVVMMLATEGLRVALATTHLPLSQVPKAITPQLLEEVITIICHEMKFKFGLEKPRIMVLGLNPHAGENGHLGREELDILIPTLEALREKLAAELIGPIPADTGFNPKLLADTDCVLAMYHDQGLPVLKYKGFGNAINITLGLPFIRTSVDHGTGLDIAGQNLADIGSMRYAINSTIDLIKANHE